MGDVVLVFLCIEEVDWNTNRVLQVFVGGVFLCIEEVDWNPNAYRQNHLHQTVFLCIEEVDWNIVALTNCGLSSCLPLYRGSGLKCERWVLLMNGHGLPLYRGSGLKSFFNCSVIVFTPVFLCIEEVDWNLLQLQYPHPQNCLPLYRGSGLKYRRVRKIPWPCGLPLYRGSGLK